MVRTKNSNEAPIESSASSWEESRETTTPRKKKPTPKKYKPKVASDTAMTKGKGKASTAEKGKGKALANEPVRTLRDRSKVTIQEPNPQSQKRQRTESSDSEPEDDLLDMAVEHAKQKLRKRTPILRQPESLPFLEGNLDDGVDKELFIQFRIRKVCPVLSLDLDFLKHNIYTKLDLVKPMSHYKPWLGIKGSYNLDVVRRFYCNMTYDEEKNILSTKLRGRKIQLSAVLLNELLGTHTFDPPVKMSSAQAYHILFQTDIAFSGQLTFKPADMCDYYRIIHYIFTRCMIIKCSSYTYFNQEEYPLLARIISGEKLNIGEFIFGQMKLFCTQRTRSMPMPYPQLVSFILQKFRIDHLENGKKLEIEPFGKIQLNRMHIELPYDANKGKIPRRNKERQPGISDSQTQDEAQSTARPSAHSQPSFLGATVQRQLHLEIAEMEARRKLFEENQEKRLTSISSQLDRQYQEFLMFREEVRKEFLDSRQAVADVKNILLAYLHNLGPSISEEELRAHTSGTQHHIPSPPQDTPIPDPPSPPHTGLPPSPTHPSSPFHTPPSSPKPYTTETMDPTEGSMPNLDLLVSSIISSSSTDSTKSPPHTSSTHTPIIEPPTHSGTSSAIIPIPDPPSFQIPSLPPLHVSPLAFVPSPSPLPVSISVPAHLSHLFDADKKGEKSKADDC